ncbi:MAG: site-2 protease family protein [Oscillospiraceae bacterium]|nr:site-2 protease family protein [Oscillospiraceae bacterium]
MSLFYILLAILIFGFLIFIHELGHFITAKLCGVRVNEFSINMGPKLFGWKRGETDYSFRLLPIGGYCAMEGEDEATGDPRAFTAAKWWKRLIILCAGSFMNLLTGFVVMCLLLGFAWPGTSTAEITDFAPGNAMESQGLQVGDTLYAINGHRIYMYSDFSLLESRLNADHCALTVLRDGEKLVFEDFSLIRAVKVVDEEGNETMMYGLSFGKRAEKSVGSVLRYAAYDCIDFSRMVWYGLADLFTGKVGLKDMSGAAGVVDVMVQSGESAKTVSDGIENVLYIGAFIAVNLAVMNMLPIPALDGGRVLFLLINTVYTAITKKKINPKYEGYIHAGAMVLLLALMAVLLVKDVWTIASR